MTSIPEHSAGVMLVDLPDYEVRAGDRGVALRNHQNGLGYALEFERAAEPWGQEGICGKMLVSQ